MLGIVVAILTGGAIASIIATRRDERRTERQANTSG